MTEVAATGISLSATNAYPSTATGILSDTSHPPSASRSNSPTIPVSGGTLTGVHHIPASSHHAQHTKAVGGRIKPEYHSRAGSQGSSALGTGAIAGIGVGCAVFGAIVASLILFLLMRKSQRSSPRRNDRQEPQTLVGQFSRSGSDTGTGNEWREEQEKPVGAMVVPLATHGHLPALEHVLPQPIDAKTLNAELSTLRSLVRNHLHNFFHNKTVERETLVNHIERSALVEIAMDTPFQPDEWIDLLASSKTRMDAVHFILSWVIFRRIEPECEPSKTLLPLGLSVCYHHMLGFTDRKQIGEFLQSKWRMITGFLLQEQYVGRAFTSSDDRVANLKATADLLDGVLHPVGVGKLHVARKDSLNEVLKSAASMGFTLASQPSSWIFDWEPPQQGNQPKPLVVFPSLVQHTNEGGQTINEVIEMGSKEVGSSILIS